jgi:hypothetical protein
MIDLNPVPNRLLRPDTLEDDCDNFFPKLPQFGADLIALQSNVSVNAAGGAYPVPFKYSGNSSNVGKGGFLVSPNNGFLYFDDLDARGIGTLAYLNSVLTSLNVTKAYLRITSQNDPTRWIAYTVTTNYAHGSGASNGNVGISYLVGNGGFIENEAVLVHISKIGDKGDIGGMPIALIRDKQATGVGPGSVTTGTWNTRRLVDLWANDIGATLSGNVFTIPAGKYWLESSAPSSGSVGHQTRLYDVTAGTVSDYGTSEFGASRSIIRILISLAAPRSFRIDHYFNGSSATAGQANNNGGYEVYTEVKITKVG